ncbi:polysaccharide deacetylase family protein [Longispora sp. K20-0274]|uniref:DUF2334 domain-containing protein n=1 Tax=Longispora sp. K20-0274 TaxID=3088255 RepID=UPI00399B2AEE
MRSRLRAGLAVAALALLVPLLSANAEASTRDTRHGHSTAHGKQKAKEADAKSAVPAPPRPAQAKPAARVVKATAAQKEKTAAAVQKAAVAAAVATPGKGAGVRAASGTSTLVLYDATGPYAWLGEIYGTQNAQLISHFGSWTAHPVGTYAAGEMSAYSAVFYAGSTYDEPLPVAFLDDVLADTKPVMWAYDNIWQLTARSASFATDYGFMWSGFDFAQVSQVQYKSRLLTRDPQNGGGIMNVSISDPTKATSLATAVRSDGTMFPWAVKARNLTYVGEIPFSYVTHDDRYLAYSDLLFGTLAPATVERHRALVRIEDVGPDADPAELRAIADYLKSKNVPFTVAVYPEYRDPLGVEHGGVSTTLKMRNAPSVVSALKYMVNRGGTLLMHGYTHQYSNIANPYDGESANDFEFYRAHVDTATNNVVYDGPVAEDSAAWATGRINSAFTEFALAGLPKPTIFEFPHYAGSEVDYAAVLGKFAVRYDRPLHFTGQLTGGAPDYTKTVGQFFPYLVRDVHGSVVIPENLGNIEPEPFNNHPARLPADIISSAQRNLAVRDGMASFFYHPYLGTDYLKTTVEGIQSSGYTFVSAAAVQAG